MARRSARAPTSPGSPRAVDRSASHRRSSRSSRGARRPRRRPCPRRAAPGPAERSAPARRPRPARSKGRRWLEEGGSFVCHAAHVLLRKAFRFLLLQCRRVLELVQHTLVFVRARRQKGARVSLAVARVGWRRLRGRVVSLVGPALFASGPAVLAAILAGVVRTVVSCVSTRSVLPRVRRGVL